ncbi:MAG: hypothetical protein KGI27_05220 [Thaumarchaeota archaeon]|nr:hypothetical protein [Nitrososphaerota archaeon]MDE1816744.1 hypothetical protein [Nitrososphaerota archaeon]
MLDKKLIEQKNLESLLHKGIDHIMVINRNGRAESVFSRSKITLSKERQEIFFMGFRLHHSLLREFDDEFEPVSHFVIHRGRTKLVSVPFDVYNVVMVMKNDVDHKSLVNKIKEIEECCNPNITELEPVCGGHGK